MNQSELNAQFYKNIFPIWNNNPNYFWSGFWLLYQYLSENFKNKSVIKVLDIGSANGRFFNFLEFCFPELKFEKYGIDFVDFEFVSEFNFTKIDITTESFVKYQEKDFDLITMFGVYHHIQGQKVRDNITKVINSKIKDDGMFIFTRWNFLLLERLRKHILRPEELMNYGIELNLKTLELGDYYLKWDKVQKSIRFSNIMDVYELETMLSISNFRCIASYNADDKNENKNTYFVCKKNSSL